MTKKIMIAAIFFIFVGCAAIHSGPSVCDVPETMSASWLCRAATASGYPLEEYGYIILDAAAIAFISENVTAEQINDFCEALRTVLTEMQGSITYSKLISIAVEEARLRAILNMVSRRLIIFQSEEIVSDIDIGFLLWQLDQVQAQV